MFDVDLPIFCKSLYLLYKQLKVDLDFKEEKYLLKIKSRLQIV